MTSDNAAALHPLDQAIRLNGEGGQYSGQTSAGYANMVGPFGGVIAATLLQGVMQHPERLGDPVALTVNFAAPIADGGFEVAARPARTSRSTQHWIMELSQGGQVAATATAITALRRETWEATDLPFPPAPAMDGLRSLKDLPGLPKWVGRYDLRLVRGGIPPLPQHEKPQAESSETLLWVRDEPPRALDFVALASICDVFFPRSFIRRQRMAMAGTVSMTVYFHADAAALAAQGERELLAHARGQRFHGGFFDQAAEIWSPEGLLLATSNQVVYFKE